jgi:iron complex outermembrane receptor protein
MKNIFKWGFLLLFSSTLSINALADDTTHVAQMMGMSLENLLTMKVTSSSGREQKLDDVANAMYVITKEDIERSGAREVADLLYRVPGLQIRQANGHQYGVGIREGTWVADIVDNILVLIDGAVVFNPMMSGVVWENLPVSLNEIERIEIIRGSPGVLYSSNAVNGVINIITKAADEKDNYVSQEGGTQSYRDTSIGVGEKIGTTGLALRAYFDNQFDQGFTKNTTSTSFSDRYLSDRDGARLDYTPSDHQRLSVIANNNQVNATSPNLISGMETKAPGQTASAIINYTDKVTDVYDYSIHFDHVEQLATLFNPDDVVVHTTSASTQHNFHYDLAGSHVTSVGGELRYNALNVEESNPFQSIATGNPSGLVTNGHATQKIISFFAQDEYRPIDKLILTAGVREDDNTMIIGHDPLYSPKVSALYHLTENQSIWASSSQTYRTPSFTDHDLSMVIVPPSPFPPYYGEGLTYRGSTDLKPEENLTQEIGYRTLLLDQKLKADATLFLTDVKDVIALNGDTGAYSNDGSLRDTGVELSLNYQYTPELSFSTDYSYLYPHSKPETANNPGTLLLDDDPSKNIIGIGARYTKNQLKLDLYAKYFEGYSFPAMAVDPINVKVRGYYKTFLRISYDFQTPNWAAGKHDATVYLEGNDLVGARKIEYTAPSGTEVFVNPAVTAGVKVKF